MEESSNRSLTKEEWNCEIICNKWINIKRYSAKIHGKSDIFVWDYFSQF